MTKEFDKNNNTIGKILSGVVLFTLIAKVLGFFREILLSYYFGATGLSDAYLISQSIPGTIFQFVGVGLTTCYIPIYFKALSNGNRHQADKFTNVITTIIILFSTVIIVITWLFTPSIVWLFASGFEGQTLYYAIWFTRIGILSLYFSTFLYVYSSYLQANNNFQLPAFAAIPNTIIIIIAIALGAKVNIWLLSIGSVIAVLAQILVLIPYVHKLKYHYRFDLEWKHSFIKDFIILFTPVIIGVSVNEINTLVDRTIASQIAVGGISALTYANSLIQFVQGGISQPIATVFYPKITAAVASDNLADAKSLVEKGLMIIMTTMIPISIGFMVFRELITNVLFGRGAFDDNAVRLTSTAILFYSIGICFMAFRELLSRYFYAYQNTKTPMINATIGLILNILMNIFLSRYIGIGGLAFATSLSAIITTILLWKDCNKQINNGVLKLSIIEVFKVFAISVLSVLLSYFIINLFVLSNILELCIAIVISIIIFVILAFICKLEIVEMVFNNRI